MSKQPLTEKQERVYQFLVKCSGDGLPPTVREICAATGIKSTSSVHGILNLLEEAGYIERDARFSRAIKIGGAATYIRRGKWLECVEAKTLPIGMLQRVDYDFTGKKLYDGDYIIMMSDGVLDAVRPEERAEFLQQIIGEDPGQNPQVIAGRILNASLLLQNFEPRDMTVLVCGVFEQKGMF